MTTLTMRLVKGDFIVTGAGHRAHEVQEPPRGPQTGARPTIPARLITEIGPGGNRGAPKKRRRGGGGGEQNIAPAPRAK